MGRGIFKCFLLSLVSVSGVILEEGCVIKTCVTINKDGFVKNEEGRECIWCENDKHKLPQSEMLALSHFAHSCAEIKAELVFPRNNWCVGYKTIETPFDAEELAGCEQDMITDPCSGKVLQQSFTDATKQIKAAAPWSGIDCSSNHRHVTEISINRNSPLQCSLADFDLSPLRKLHTLRLSETRIKGDLKTDWLSKLPLLSFLDLSKNQLTGNLEHLFNNPTSTIPKKFQREGSGCKGLCALVNLDLTDNLIQGEIPQSLGDIPRLQHLSLKKNQLTGIVPENLINHEVLKRVDVRNNQNLKEA